MHRIAIARKILARAQDDLRELIAKALADGRFADVAEIARMADGVARLATDDDQPVSSDQQHPPAAPPAVSRHGTIVRGGRVRPSRAFPRFEREGDKLVKIAWSKKGRAEYEHKAPRRVADTLIAAIRSRKGEGAKFEAPDVLPLLDPKTRREIPSYQSYLALAWLRHEGVVAKYGRDGYALKPTEATPEHLTELWEALPSRD